MTIFFLIEMLFDGIVALKVNKQSGSGVAEIEK
jgi:hypothetical protein